jgi:hypothetical protein
LDNGDRPFANPEAAARKLLDIVRTSIAKSGLPYAYSGATNFAAAPRALGDRYVTEPAPLVHGSLPSPAAFVADGISEHRCWGVSFGF